jgi:hypothetical protein
MAEWDSPLRSHQVDLCLSVPDHDLQQLEFKGHPFISAEEAPSFVGWRRLPRTKAVGLRAVGFTNLQFSKEELG